LNTARTAELRWPRHGHGPFFERLENSIFFECMRKFHKTEQQTYFGRKNMLYPYQDDHLFISHNLSSKLKTCDVVKNDTTLCVSDHIPILAEIDDN